MIARSLCSRGGRPVGIRIGGFNLLPYRQRLARGRRLRLVIESGAAVLAGVLAALAWVASDAFEQAGLAERRAALDATLAGLAAPLAEYRRLERVSAQASEHAVLAAELARPRARMVDVVEALSRAPDSGVVLRRLRMTGGGLELDANAADHDASAAWVDRLARVRGVRTAEITAWRVAAQGAPYATEVALRLQWDDAQAAAQAVSPAASGPSGGPDARRGRR